MIAPSSSGSGLSFKAGASVVAVASTVASPVMSCEPGYNPVNDRVVQEADCSFANGDSYDDWSGRAVRDIGGRMVAQRQQFGVCTTLEVLALVDCGTGRAVDIYGKDLDAPPDAVFGVHALLDSVLAPTGPLAIREGESFDVIVRNALAADITVRSSLNDARYTQSRGWDRPDPMCGCRLFYPDSPGATQ